MWALECQYELPPLGEEFTLQKLCFAALRRDPAKMTAGNQPPLGLLSVLGVSLKNKVLVGITPPRLVGLRPVQTRVFSVGQRHRGELRAGGGGEGCAELHTWHSAMRVG